MKRDSEGRLNRILENMGVRVDKKRAQINVKRVLKEALDFDFDIWEEAGWEDYDEAERWYDNGWDDDFAEEALRFYKAGWDEPLVAYEWYDAGWDVPEEGIKWYRNSLWKNDPDGAWRWYAFGRFKDPETAEKWYKAGWRNPEKAKKMYDKGYRDPKKALKDYKNA